MKHFTLLFVLCSLFFSPAWAQDTFQFLDNRGNVVNNGATVTVDNLVDDEFMGSYIPSGINVKNASESNASIRIAYEIETLDNGTFQICFPENCISKSETGSFTTTKGTMTPEEVRSLQCEWFPEAMGTCKVRLTIEELNVLGAKTADGPSIEVVFNYGNVVIQYPKVWWGYVDDGSTKTGLGVAATDTYHCAIFIPGNHTVAAGKSIDAIRFGLTAPSATNVKVWTATTLPSSISTKTCTNVVDVPAKELGSEDIQVYLPQPYEIPAEGVYVGYSFKISRLSNQDDNYPVLTTGNDAPNALLLRAESKVPSWSDLNGQNFGSLFLMVQLEGTFEENIVTPADFGPVYAETGKIVTAQVALTNNGGTPVSEINYTITTGSNTTPEYHAAFENPIPAFATRVLSLAFSSDQTQGKSLKTLTVTKVNGYDNNATDKTADFTLYSFDEIIPRNVVVEQYTGTGCGYCPRGHVGMANLREAFPDRFIGIALHQYSGQSSDAMYIKPSTYANLNFGGAPSCRMDRGEEMDPYVGTGWGVTEDFKAELAIPAFAAVTVEGNFNENNTKVDARATVTPVFDGDYDVEFVLVADGLKGTGTGWLQTNYYSYAYAASTGYTKASLPDDLKFLFDLGSTYTPTFNDVAIASSYVSSKNKVVVPDMAAGVASEVSYTLTMPTYTKLKNALKLDQIYVVALVTSKDGRIIQAVKAKVNDSTTGIEDAYTQSGAEGEALYDLQGHKVSAPQRGINIIRMSDGTVRKVATK